MIRVGEHVRWKEHEGMCVAISGDVPTIQWFTPYSGPQPLSLTFLERIEPMSESLKAAEALSAEGAHAPRVSLDDIKTNIATQATFILADALRAMGLPAVPRAEVMTVCVATTKSGYVLIGTAAPADSANFDAAKGATWAYEDVVSQLWPLMGYTLRERLQHSPAVQDAIRQDLAGVPLGRTDVSPTALPALRDPPKEFTMARSAALPIEDGMVDPEALAKAWEDVRAQVAAADPAFPAHLLGYTLLPDDSQGPGHAITQVVLTVYA